MSHPEIAIGFVTYKRTAMALETVRTTIENLQYPKDRRGWYIADDGSDGNHVQKILDLLEQNGEKVIGWHSERIRNKNDENSFHAGKGWNKCLGICHQFSDFVLWLEDDWRLDESLDPSPHVRILMDREDVGAVTYRILSQGANVHTVGYQGEIYLQYLRETQYAYSGNPYLRHARYTRSYGWFAEDRNPGLIELHMDDQYRFKMDEGGLQYNDGKPWIWRPASISIWGSWKHIGSEKSWS